MYTYYVSQYITDIACNILVLSINIYIYIISYLLQVEEKNG